MRGSPARQRAGDGGAPGLAAHRGLGLGLGALGLAPLPAAVGEGNRRTWLPSADDAAGWDPWLVNDRGVLGWRWAGAGRDGFGFF